MAVLLQSQDTECLNTLFIHLSSFQIKRKSVIITLHPDGNTTQRIEYPTEPPYDQLDKNDLKSSNSLLSNTSRHIDRRETSRETQSGLQNLAHFTEYRSNVLNSETEEGKNMLEETHVETEEDVDLEEVLEAWEAAMPDEVTNIDNVTHDIVKLKLQEKNKLESQEPREQERGRLLKKNKKGDARMEEIENHDCHGAENNDDFFVENHNSLRDSTNSVTHGYQKTPTKAMGPIRRKRGRGRPRKIKRPRAGRPTRKSATEVLENHDASSSVDNINKTHNILADTANSVTYNKEPEMKELEKTETIIAGSERKAMAQYGIQHNAAKASKFFSKKLGFHVSSGTVTDFMKRYKTLMAMLNRVPTSAEMVEESKKRTFTETQKKLAKSYTKEYGLTTAAQLCSRKWRFVVNENTLRTIIWEDD